MNVSLLRERLDELLESESIPGKIASAIAWVARSNKWDEFRASVGDWADELEKQYRSDPEQFLNSHDSMGAISRECLSFRANQSLGDVSRLVFGKRRAREKYELPETEITLEGEEALEFLESITGLRARHDAMDRKALFEVSFAYKLIDLIEPAAIRASHVADWVVNEPSSPQADQYLAEACECFYFGLYTACTVMCRSLVEEVLERKLSNAALEQLRNEARDQKPTLGLLLHKVNNMSPMPVPVEFPRLARKLNELGSRAAHQEPASMADAFTALHFARECLVMLLGGESELLAAQNSPRS